MQMVAWAKRSSYTLTRIMEHGDVGKSRTGQWHQQEALENSAIFVNMKINYL